MNITQIKTNKKRFLPLLLLGDEQESMIDRYLERGDMFVMFNNEKQAIAVAVVTVEDEKTIELKNLAVSEPEQGKGFGRQMLNFLFRFYGKNYETLLVGTGDVQTTIGFYEHCGFAFSHRVKDFFLKNYDHPIIENGVQLKDMVYLKRQIAFVG